MIFEDFDDRIPVTTFAIRFVRDGDEPCPVCHLEFDRDDEACFIDDEIHHYACVEDTHRSRA